MVWLLIYYVFTGAMYTPVQLSHEFTSKEECERAADILWQHNPRHEVEWKPDHVCMGVMKK